MAKSLSKKNMIIILSAAAVVVIAAVVALALYFGTDIFSREDNTPAECAHDYVAVDSEYDRPATFDTEGRQLMVCSRCGKSYLAVIPRIEKADGTEAPDYYPLFEEYRVIEGVTLGEIAEKYFTAGWSFAEDEDTPVGSAGYAYSYEVIFRSSSEGYEEVRGVVSVIVETG